MRYPSNCPIDRCNCYWNCKSWPVLTFYVQRQMWDVNMHKYRRINKSLTVYNTRNFAAYYEKFSISDNTMKVSLYENVSLTYLIRGCCFFLENFWGMLNVKSTLLRNPWFTSNFQDKILFIILYPMHDVFQFFKNIYFNIHFRYAIFHRYILILQIFLVLNTTYKIINRIV